MTTNYAAENQASAALAKADELMRQERNAHPRPVPLLLRCAEIESLEPWQRSKVATEAAREIARNPFMRCVKTLWMVVCLLSFFSFVPQHHQPAALLALAIVVVVLPLLASAAVTRRRIREKVRQSEPLDQSAHA